MKIIRQLLDVLYPDTEHQNKFSILCLTTSNPVYLIFNNTSSLPVPEIVIHLVDNNEIQDIYKKTQELYTLLGNIIAEPLHLIEDKENTFFIEKGLKGSPWFQLSDKFKAEKEWHNIKLRASSTLTLFHHAILKSSFGPQAIDPGYSLRAQYQEYLKFNTSSPDSLSDITEKFAQHLDQLGTINSFSQHGDYCLNNLLFENECTHIIDFEDLGMTAAPLHDEFSLALSFYSLTHIEQNASLKSELTFCTSQSYWNNTFSIQVIQALFLHHLLLRLGRWCHDKKRTQFKEWLLQILSDFLKNPDDFFSDNQTK